jgi:tetrahydromethanopterin S-methyltransferase subunit C
MCSFHFVHCLITLVLKPSKKTNLNPIDIFHQERWSGLKLTIEDQMVCVIVLGLINLNRIVFLEIQIESFLLLHFFF